MCNIGVYYFGGMEKSKLTEKEKREAKEKIKALASVLIITAIAVWIKNKWKISHHSTKFFLIFIGVCIILFGSLNLWESIFSIYIIIGGIGYLVYIRYFGKKRINVSDSDRNIDIILFSGLILYLLYLLFTGTWKISEMHI